MATTARQQLHRQQKTERASRPQKAIALLRKSRRRRTAVLGGLAAVLALTLLVLTLPLWARDTSRLCAP